MSLIVIGICLSVYSSTAAAFPILLGVVAPSLVGVVFWPALLVLGLGYALQRWLGGRLILLVPMLIAAGVAFLALRQPAADMAPIRNIYEPSGFQSLMQDQQLPFGYTSSEEQAASPLAVTPREFMEGLQAGTFKALRISTYPSFFMEDGQVSAQEIWRNPQLFIEQVNKLNGRVVLVDDFGGIAASIAKQAEQGFGLRVGFLQDGVQALSEYGWDELLESAPGQRVDVADFRSWIASHPDVPVLSLTTAYEFVDDGWVFGDRTLTLADFVTNFDALAGELKGNQVFIVGFETNDIGATPVVAHLLHSAGAEPVFVVPSEDDLLVTDPYYDPYHNHQRLIGLDDAKRILLHRDDVVFIDFNDKPWPVAKYLQDRYIHIDKGEVAKGRLAQLPGQLDLSKVYVGLGFNKRTSYHGLLAGEAITRSGGHWLGRVTQPELLTLPTLEYESMQGAGESATYLLKTQLAKAGAVLLGAIPALLWLPLGFLAGLLLIVGMQARRPKHLALVLTQSSAVVGMVLLARADYPYLEAAYQQLGIGLTIGSMLGCIIAWRRRHGAIRAFVLPRVWPAKALNLREADRLGYRVAAGWLLLNEEDIGQISIPSRGRYVVRSAAAGEADDHAQSAGIFESFIGGAHEVPDLARRVFARVRDAGAGGGVLVQRYVEARHYGVAQFLDHEASYMLACDMGAQGGVTGGVAPAISCQVPVWEVSKAMRPARKALRALVQLSQRGAHSIEFAVDAWGRLTILQVNKRPRIGACADYRLAEMAGAPCVEIPTIYRTPLAAAIVAGLSAGNVHAFGARLFSQYLSHERGLQILRDDLRKVGCWLPCTFRWVLAEPFLRLQHCPEVIEWARAGELPKPLVRQLRMLADQAIAREKRLQVGRNECPKESLRVIVASIAEFSQSVAILNRIGTLGLAFYPYASWEGRPDVLPSSLIGQALSGAMQAEFQGMPVEPVAGFDPYGAAGDFSLDELSSEQIETSSPFAYLKDVATVLLMVRLAKLKPLIHQVIAAGLDDQLLEQVGSQLGHWRAGIHQQGSAVTPTAPALLRDLIAGTARKQNAWRIPAEGVEGDIKTPEQPGAGDILLIPDCRMDYLPLLGDTRAVIAIEGAITSHLMQHAASRGLPVVFLGEIPKGLCAGGRVAITSSGKVTTTCITP